MEFAGTTSQCPRKRCVESDTLDQPSVWVDEAASCSEPVIEPDDLELMTEEEQRIFLRGTDSLEDEGNESGELGEQLNIVDEVT